MFLCVSYLISFCFLVLVAAYYRYMSFCQVFFLLQHWTIFTRHKPSAPLIGVCPLVAWGKHIWSFLQLQLCSFNVVIDTRFFFLLVNYLNPLCFRLCQLQLRLCFDPIRASLNVFCRSCFIVESNLSVVCKSIRHFIWIMLLHSKSNITLKVDASFVICSALLKFLNQNVVWKKWKYSTHSCNFVTFTLAFWEKGCDLPLPILYYSVPWPYVFLSLH